MATNDVCPRCEGMGWHYRNLPMSDPNYGKAFRCECQRETDNAQRLAVVMDASNLTSAMCERMTFDTFCPERHLEAFHASREFAVHPAGWLVFIGFPGNGKSHLLVAMTQALVANGRSPLYVVTPDLLRYLRRGYSDGSADTRLDVLRDVDVLLLDDLGTEQTTEWAATQLYDTLDYRYRAELPTVIASNVAMGEWPFRLQSRARDKRLSRVVGFGGSDYRQSDGKENA
jgi:DNA replication protein DnaC